MKKKKSNCIATYEFIFDNDLGFLFDTGAHYLLPFVTRIDKAPKEQISFFLEIGL